MLKPHELQRLWLQVPEARRVAFLAALTQEAADSLLAFQVAQQRRERERQERRKKGSQQPPAGQ